ncbi:MAG: hypothetical protein LAT61_00480 [Alcanivorax sp.]|nr:hypothetical protein [Alcanivorax sp.]
MWRASDGHVPRLKVLPSLAWPTALMRMGQVWQLKPVPMCQNCHLVRHLYPTAPFYRYGKAWAARERRHRAKSGSMIIGPFGLGPRQGMAGLTKKHIS